MYNLVTRESPTNRPQLNGTLWHCARCNSFVTVHSVKRVDEALCPVCADAELEFCGNFDSILGGRFADA